MWGVQEIGIVLVLVLAWLIGWLRLKKEGGRKFRGGGGGVWCGVVCDVVCVVCDVKRKKDSKM